MCQESFSFVNIQLSLTNYQGLLNWRAEPVPSPPVTVDTKLRRFVCLQGVNRFLVSLLMPIFSMIIKIQSAIPQLILYLQKLMNGKWITCPRHSEDNKNECIFLNYLNILLNEVKVIIISWVKYLWYF